jgi:hypothetical protein
MLQRTKPTGADRVGSARRASAWLRQRRAASGRFASKFPDKPQANLRRPGELAGRGKHRLVAG